MALVLLTHGLVLMIHGLVLMIHGLVLMTMGKGSWSSLAFFCLNTTLNQSLPII